MPAIGTFAVLILLCNLIGMVPGFMPPTGNIIITLSLALCSFVTYNFLGHEGQGLPVLPQFLGPVLPMAIMFLPIEIVSHLARVTVPLDPSLREHLR